MARGDNEIMINFPAGLMNTAVSANIKPQSYARHIENMVPAEQSAGAGSKRAGLIRKWDEVTQGTVREVIEFRKADGSLEILLYTEEVGKFTVRRVNGDDTNTLILDNLDSTGLGRFIPFNQKVIFVNGVDNNKSYDGTTWEDLEEEVTETPVTAFVDSTNVTVAGDVTARYTNGAFIRVEWDGGEVVTTVDSSSFGSGVTTITIDSGAITNSPPIVVSYKDKPLPFSDIMKFNGYLYALSGGVTNPYDYRGNTGLTIFQTDRPNNENAWFNPITQGVPFLNTADHHLGEDEYLRLSQLGGFLIAHGRTALQVWNISDITQVGGAQWQKTIPVGLANGQLLQNFPSDVLIFTPYGARSLKTVFQTEGLEVTNDLGTNLDPTITEEVKRLFDDDDVYKNALSFLYEGGGFYGFRLNEKLLVYSLSEESKGWVIFSGLFSGCTAAKGLSDGRLIVFNGGKGYVYGNGRDREQTVSVSGSDDGAPIKTIWWTKWFRFKQRWANLYWQLLLESSDQMDVEFIRLKETNENEVTSLDIDVDASSPLWDEALWDTETWTIGSKEPRVRDKFTAKSFSFLVKTNNTEPDFTILGVKSIGR